MTLDEFIAEIETTFANYSDTGDLDRISIKTWVILCLRQMGVNICDVRERICEVKNSQSLLPENFKSLKLALKLNPEGFNIKGNVEKAMDSYIYKQRIEQEAVFNTVTFEYDTNCNSKIVTEKIFLNAEPAEFYYTPEWLSLVKGINKDSLSSDCKNLHPSIRNSYPHEISITGRTIQTNFKQGQIYIQYNSLPSDEEGEIIIPEITTGDLVQYVEGYVKCKIAENLILNNKNPQALSQLFVAWKSELPQLKHAALTECRFKGLSKDWTRKFKTLNRRDIAIFELPQL